MSRTIRAAVAALLLLTLVAVPSVWAYRPRLMDGSGQTVFGRWHRWLAESRMPLPRGTLTLVTARCPWRRSFSGCVNSRTPRTLYVRPNALNPRGVLYHELGHAFDFTVLWPGDRRAFKRLLRLSGGWFSGHGPPSELFAEAYALCARFGGRRVAASQLLWTHSLYGYRPSRRQHRLACRLIEHAATHRKRRQRPPAHPPPLIEQQPPQLPQGVEYVLPM
jgi:hypothetical protein